MTYTITNQTNQEGNEVTILQVNKDNNAICFAWDQGENYNSFRQALIEKGIDAFVDLLIEDSNTAFLTFTDGY